jgi:hypothetical protein
MGVGETGVGDTGVGKMGVGETGVGKMGVGKLEVHPNNMNNVLVNAQLSIQHFICV